MALILVFLAASLSSLANFFIRKNLDNQGTANGHLLASFGCSLLVSLAMNPHILNTSFSFPMFFTGLATGTMIFAMMGLTALTLTKGPAGLTFAFQTSGSVFPAIVLFMLFGSSFGFALTLSMGLGLVLVLIGLMWAAKEPNSIPINKSWLKFALGILFLHMMLLAIIQWRCLSFSDTPNHFLIPFRCTPEEDAWFPPGMFTAAFLLQAGLVCFKGTFPSKKDLILGSLGGSFNGAATYFLLLATTLATPIEKGILFPAFSVGIIMICNLWGYFLYSERVNWYAHCLCSVGIVLASS